VELIDTLKNAISDGKVVKLVLENSGVYCAGKTYYCISNLDILVNDKEVFSESEKVMRGSTMWLSNYTGARLEKMFSDISEALYEYCSNIAEEMLRKENVSDYHCDESGNIVFEKNGITYWIVFTDSYERHYIGKHIFVVYFYKPVMKT